jgi:hypothetical protein
MDGVCASSTSSEKVRAAIEERGGGFGSGGSLKHAAAVAGATAPGASAGGGGTKVQWANPVVAAPSGAKSTGTQPTARATKPAPAATRAGALLVGIHSPVSKMVIGDHIGIEGPPRTCWTCSKPGHYKGECPVAYGRIGKALPGWDKDGDRKTGAWNGDEPKKATYKAWVRFLSDKNNFPSGQAEVAGLRDAATLSSFQERADNARP